MGSFGPLLALQKIMLPLITNRLHTPQCSRCWWPRHEQLFVPKAFFPEMNTTSGIFPALHHNLVPPLPLISGFRCHQRLVRSCRGPYMKKQTQMGKQSWPAHYSCSCWPSLDKARMCGWLVHVRCSLPKIIVYFQMKT